MKILQYVLDCTLIWLVFYLVYYLLLRKETFFQLNRIFLVGGVLTGLLLPFIRYVPAQIYLDPDSTLVYPISKAVDLSYLSFEAESETGISYSLYLIYIIYLAGVFFFLGKMISGFWKIYRLYRSGKKTKYPAFVFVETAFQHLPFSFFKWIFWSKGLTFEKIDQTKILAHELVHVKEKHSLDILIIEFLGIIFWFNPIIYLYRSSIRENHEFICDGSIGRANTNYSQLLKFGKPGELQMALTNQFFKNHIKNRIIMLKKNPSARYLKYKSLLIVPVMIFFIVVLAFKIENSAPVAPVLKDCVSSTSDVDAQKICTEKVLLEKIYKSIIYPAGARKTATTGIAILGVTFNKTGMTNHEILFDDENLFGSAFKPVIEELKSVQFSLKEAEQVSFTIPVLFRIEEGETREAVRSSNKIPGIEKYQSLFSQDFLVVTGYGIRNSGAEIPVEVAQDFNVKNDQEIIVKKKVKTEEIKVVRIRPDADQEGKPLLKLHKSNSSHGKIITDEEFAQINPDDIEKINVIKGEMAVKTHGTEGRNGVVEIYIKKEANNSEANDPQPVFYIYNDQMELTRTIHNPKVAKRLLEKLEISKVNTLSAEEAYAKYNLKNDQSAVEVFVSAENNNVVVDPESIKPEITERSQQGNIVDLQVFPNPTNDRLNIIFKTKNNSVKINYHVTDLQGKTVLQGKEVEMDGQWDLKIDVQTLPEGQYYLILNDGRNNHQKPFQIGR